MSYTMVNARDIILQLDFDRNSTFLPVACLTANSFEISRDAIDADSKCGDLQLPGDSVSQTISCSGHAIDQAGAVSRESYERLYFMLTNKVQCPARFGPATPVPGDIVYTGEIFVTSLSLDATDKETMKFEAEFMVAAPPLTQTKTY